jgi:hypothetical protein
MGIVGRAEKVAGDVKATLHTGVVMSAVALLVAVAALIVALVK